MTNCLTKLKERSTRPLKHAATLTKMWLALSALFSVSILLSACEERGPIVVGKIEKRSSCQYPVRENWTQLCLGIEAVKVGYYRKGDRFDVRLSVRNEGDTIVEDVSGHLQSFAFYERVVEFGDVAPGDEVSVELRLEAGRDEVWNNIAFFISSEDPCDFRSQVIFPPIKDPKRIGMCADVFEQINQGESE